MDATIRIEPMSEFSFNLDNTGLVLAAPGDVIPETAFTNLLNMTSNRAGYIETRRGTARVSSTNLGAAVHSQGRIIIRGTAYLYQGASTILYRAFAQIATAFSGNPLTMRDAGPDLSIKPQLVVFDTAKRVKDDGTTTTAFGIPSPLRTAAAVAGTIISKTIDLFEYATDGAIQAVWTDVNCTITTTTVDPKQGTYAGKVAVAASQIAYVERSVTLDLSKFVVAGDSDDSDVIHLWMKISSPLRFTEIKVMLDVDGSTNDFTQNYYWKSILPGDLTASSNSGETAAEAQARIAYQTSLTRINTFPSTSPFQSSRPLQLDNELEGTFFGDTAPTTQPLDPGLNQWNELFIPKGSFVRVGTSTNNWANVAKVRIAITSNTVGAIDMYLDDMKMQGGVRNRLNGEYEWIYQYENQNTKSRSPFSAVMPDQVEILSTSADLTLANPRDTQVTHIRVYRRGGTLTGEEFFLSVRYLVTAWTGNATVTDGIPDDALGEPATLDQIELANLDTTISAIAVAFKKTLNSGAAYTDYTADVGGGAGVAVLSSLDTVANGDWVIVGAGNIFRKILVEMNANVNVNASVLTVEYWTGAAWAAVSNLSDGTALAGATFGKSGNITFDYPEDWEISTIDTGELYFVRLSVSAALDASVEIAEVRLSATDIEPSTCETHRGRLWVDDSNHPDRLWFSEALATEQFTESGWIAVHPAGDPIVRHFALDEQLFVFTGKTIQRVIGDDPDSFEAISTGSAHGLFSKYAITKGDGKIFYRAHDGIYELRASGFAERISKQIDTLFSGLSDHTEANLQKIDKAQSLSERLAYFDKKVWFSYTAIDGNRYELKYDTELNRWEPTNLSVTSYLTIEDENLIYSGSADGYVYERETGYQDQGVDISIDWQSKFFDFGAPDRDKYLTEAALDCDLGGAALRAYLVFNGGISQIYQAITGSGRQRVRFPVPEETLAQNVAIRVTGANGGNRVRFYKNTFYYSTGPAQALRFDSLEMDFGYTRWKFVRRLWLAVKAPGEVAVTVYVDGVIRHTTTFQVDPEQGWRKVVLVMPPGVKGMLFRVVATSTTPFTMFLNQSDVEWHALASQRGYSRSRILSAA